MRLITLLIIALLLAACGKDPKPDLSNLPNSPSSFSQAKSLLYKTVHKGHQETFYCDCKYAAQKKRFVYLGSCDVKPRKNTRRAKQLEAEHVLPASFIGQTRACWREKLCKDSKGNAYGGRRCCEKIDPVFKRAHNDLHNLQPSVGEVNADRSNRKYGTVAGEPRAYGACDFEVDWESDRVEPADHIKGNIARTYFYMRDTYKVRLSGQQTKLLEAWDKQDPVDSWEKERNTRIKSIQGMGNPYIER